MRFLAAWNAFLRRSVVSSTDPKTLQPPKLKLMTQRKINGLIANYIRQHASDSRETEILEAGCGRRWPLDLQGLQYRLTGIDLDEAALALRKTNHNDLDDALLADLRYADVKPKRYDVIYCAFVLEHVQGAELVLKNFLRWIRPGGLIILKFPDRDSVYGFFTRITPFWLHVFYRGRIMGVAQAGMPGFPPYPTHHDKIISRREFYRFARDNDTVIKEEYGFGQLPPLQNLFTKFVQRASMGKLAADHHNLVFILQVKDQRCS